MRTFTSASARNTVLLAAGTIALAVVLAGPGRGMRADIAQQKRDVRSQLSVTSAQLDHVAAQRRELTRQLKITSSQLAIAERQLSLMTRQERLTTEMLQMQRRLLDTIGLQRRLLALAEQMLREIKEINRKMPPPSP